MNSPKPMQWYYDNQCDLAVNDHLKLFPALYAHERGEPCLGCNEKDDCVPWKALQAAKQMVQREVAGKQNLKTVKDGVTNADIAKVLGVSKRQASKMRSEGKVNLDDVANAMGVMKAQEKAAWDAMR